MRIGIDIDDTICRTTEIVDDYMEKYAKEHKLNVLDIVNDEELKKQFFSEYLPEIFEKAEVKSYVRDSLRRLRNKGNKLFLVTARSDDYVPGLKNVEEITSKWLEKNNIKVDGAFYGVYGIDKAKVCIENDLDVMIDDDPYNYHKMIGEGVTCLLYDDREKYNLRDNYATSWLEVEDLVEKLRR